MTDNDWQILKLWNSPIEGKYLDQSDEIFTKDKNYTILGVTKDEYGFNFLVINDKGIFYEESVDCFIVTKSKNDLFPGGP